MSGVKSIVDTPYLHSVNRPLSPWSTERGPSLLVPEAPYSPFYCWPSRFKGGSGSCRGSPPSLSSTKPRPFQGFSVPGPGPVFIRLAPSSTVTPALQCGLAIATRITSLYSEAPFLSRSCSRTETYNRMFNVHLSGYYLSIGIVCSDEANA